MAMNKIRVMTIIGTRPEIIRLSRVIAELDKFTDHILVHTGQNYDYELNEVFFQDLSIRKPDHFLEAAGQSSAETIGNVIAKADALIRSQNPDAVLILGDTNSCMAAIAAKRAQIPVFHMEAGNRCYDQRVPEEINRRIIDHCADVNLTYSDIARDNLLREGLRPDLTIKTGSPMLEVLNYYKDKIERSTVLEKLELQPHKYFVVSSHREENIANDDNFQKFTDVLNEIAAAYELPVFVSTHPRTQKKIDSFGAKLHPLVNLIKPLGFTDYVKLQCEAKAVISDSGTITEEASILNFPAINLRETHERMEGMEEAAVMMVGLDKVRVLQALDIISDQPRGQDRLLRNAADYSMPNVSNKVLRMIISYTDYVNRTVWKKY
ncbi:non-hydrolyzing UDP-N-acetylglucosamine 2-epimerase [Sphingorhabdus sp. M41]|uniref:non-hydrolyzing UDP-N-acetylglucosamine 2-epimerase n=1 Tax=Sphingorhabdus sp. M41 TaxID=1806885 RepID=UPI000A6BEFD1|nr:UDP-N-acetylglucosamine 2-epimerase (non-hydrolyzing) [Sphingorhabdus sp. M41]